MISSNIPASFRGLSSERASLYSSHSFTRTWPSLSVFVSFFRPMVAASESPDKKTVINTDTAAADKTDNTMNNPVFPFMALKFKNRLSDTPARSGFKNT